MTTITDKIDNAYERAKQNSTSLSTIEITLNNDKTLEEIEQTIQETKIDSFFWMPPIPLKEEDNQVTYKKLLGSGAISPTIEYTSNFCRIYISSDENKDAYKKLLTKLEENLNE